MSTTEATRCTASACGRPTDWYVCQHCGDLLADSLRNMPWLFEQLDLAVTRQVRYGSRNGGRSTEIPLPVNLQASDAQHNLVNEITTTARIIAEDNGWAGPSGTTLDAAEWLLYKISAVRLHVAGGQMVDALAMFTAAATWAIDRPRERQYLGNCEDQNHGDDEREVCTGAVYGKADDEWAQCDMCRTRWLAEAIREQLLLTLDDRLCTAAEIAKLSTYLGLRSNRTQVRNLVSVWAKRGRIERHSTKDGDDPAYRFGIVWRLLMQEDSTRQSA